MKIGHQQIPRSGLIWLLLTQALVILPQLSRLPIWVVVVAIICALWRIMIFRSRWSYPKLWIKVLVVGAAVIGTLFHYGTIVGLEAGVALLVTTFLLKLLEMKNLRDAYLVIFLSYFVVVTEFLYSQSILVSSYMLFTLLVITSALVGLHTPHLGFQPWRTFRKGAVLVVQSIPLMILLFLFVPRISPLWRVEFPQTNAKSGVSETISPGDIANLSKSDGLAFRATFKGDIPPRDLLYWRGLVMSHFDGRRWTQGSRELGQASKLSTNLAQLKSPLLSWPNLPARWERRMEKIGKVYEYDVIIEPTQQHWLFSLANPENNDNNIALVRDFRLVAAQPITQRTQYSVKSYLDSHQDKDLPVWLKRLNLQLPPFGNPRARVMAQQFWVSSGKSVENYIEKILVHFRQEPYFYTLKPPLLGRDSVDEFLINSKRGFCAHYASAFVFLMRTAGIPARMVAGYQGGEINKAGNYVQVRHFDAHAWAEVWVPNRGWVRVDPTAAVAPERVEEGLEAAVAEEGSFLAESPLSPLRFRNVPFLNNVRMQWELLEYQWQRWVLNYDQAAQLELFERWFGGKNWYVIVFTIAGSMFALIGLLALWIIWRQRPQAKDPASQCYLAFCKRMEKHGLIRNIDEPPHTFLARIKQRQPKLSAKATVVTELYVKLMYQPAALTPQEHKEQLVQMKSAVKSLR
ncbi:DUF3488 domain-containing transglutaminase family protein [Endozoicomonas sp. SM1973]|uniref:DUF3488 domain-containing transglutaminase family protein n=1 Tax=Spartinivicinus marinus TaxID=2994442 RepID=A0A853I798_9GAMM|nr:DUF3488 and transglutaminase-like domain-containing protein [Spartinivicinus marinus]MCX4024829.1 DUF3488 and transglutaminase-like domain-containing protein [Spartinivicinus marinus]NYZ66528.1 DUF3488 domain-containing transglutaminase family protein [Spartinivicinus marinus]